MVPGFNTDFKYRGETYHVQTEDNGASNPVVVTLLYHKGAILASRKTPYRDLLDKPGFEQELMALMKAQHKELMKSLLSGSFDKNGTAPSVAGSSGENPAEAAGAIVASMPAPAQSAAGTVSPAAPPPSTLRRAAHAASLRQKLQQPAPVVTTPASPSAVAAPAGKHSPAAATLDEAIRDYLQACASSAATTAH